MEEDSSPQMQLAKYTKATNELKKRKNHSYAPQQPSKKKKEREVTMPIQYNNNNKSMPHFFFLI